MRLALVVDDEPVLRRSLSRLLTRMGFEVLEAADGPEALELSTRAIDVMLLDVKLPGVEGWDVLRQVRVCKATLPVIMMTGEAQADVPEDDYMCVLDKPFNKLGLQTALSRWFKIG